MHLETDLTGPIGFCALAFLISFIAQQLVKATDFPRTLALFFALTIAMLGIWKFGKPEDTSSGNVVQLCLGFILLPTGIRLGFGVLKTTWKSIAFGGLFYTFLAAILTATVYYLSRDTAPTSAFFIGAAVAMSSTILAHERLEEAGKLHTPIGQFCVGILLAQDFMLLPFSLLANWMKHHDGTSAITINPYVPLLFLGGICLLLILLVVEILFTKTFFKVIEQENETNQIRYYTTIGMLICGTCWLAMNFGGFSFPLGMFMAGLVISDTDKKERVVHLSHNLTYFTLPILVISLAIRLDYDLLIEHWIVVLVCISSILLLKEFTGFVVGISFGFGKRTAMRMGALLFPMGATAVELATEAHHHGHITEFEFQIINAVVVFSMMIFPFYMKGSLRISRSLRDKEPLLH